MSKHMNYKLLNISDIAPKPTTSTRPRVENYKGQWDPDFIRDTKIHYQNYYGRGVDEDVLEGTDEWDALKRDAWLAKQDAFTNDAEKAKAKYKLKKRRLLRDRHGVLSK